MNFMSAKANPLIPKAHAIYYYSVLLVGFSVLGLAIEHVCTGGLNHYWLIIAALTALTGRFTVKLPSVKSKISVADAFIFTNVILFGPSAGSVTAALEGFLGSIRSHAIFSKRIKYTLFNVATMAASSYFSGKILFLILRESPLYGSRAIPLWKIMLPVLSMALVHYLCNTISVAIMVALEGHQNLYKVWRERFLHTSLTYFAGASAAALFVVNFGDFSLSTLGLILPILFVTYFAYKTYLDKAEENAHRRQLDKLYLRTVEVLSVAIDARESGTLGHSKRVQVYANGLARALNVTDEKIYRGIEAAALLLDIGNLAIPEYILNKPGELSGSEIQKVMTHPVVGAKILSTIEFPYPLTDFVLHHHERWDGSGYPAKLQGDQIPLGARILSIADCFDALTCDRPYQKAHSKQEALSILRSKTGTHYDPQLVAIFEQIADDMVAKVKEIEASEARAEASMGFGESTRADKPLRRSNDLGVFGDISSTQKEIFVLNELTQALSSTLSLEESLATIASKLAKIVSFTTCVIYLYLEDSRCVRAECVGGANEQALKGHTLEIDNSLSGWVVMESEPVINANALHDLGLVEKNLAVRLENALVYPLIIENKCSGTISLYSAEGSRFKQDDLRIVATVAAKAAAAIQNAMRFEEARTMALTDPLTLLPNLRYLHHFFEKEIAKAKLQKYPISVMGMDLDGFKAVNDRYGHQVGDQILVEVARILRGVFRGEDLVVRHGGDEFFAALIQIERRDALQLMERIQNTVDGLRLEITPGNFAQIGISIGYASYPDDGDTVEQLIKKADHAMYRNKTDRKYGKLAPAPSSHSIGHFPANPGDFDF
jgi:diguanylate cyclase (GGDEF)-like protein